MLDLEKIYEALLYWRGNLNATEFAQAVGRTRQHVQTRIITPLSKHPDVREERGKKHGRTLLTPPGHAPAGLWAFFNLLATEREWRRVADSGHEGIAGIAVEDVVPPSEAAASASIVSRAAGQRCALIGNYLFKNHGARAVSFSPHTMVRTPRRIHFRGHLLVQEHAGLQDRGYVDLVPGRFIDDGNLRLDPSGYRDASGDEDWHERITVAFEVNPALPQDAYLALQQEHGIEPDRDGRSIKRFRTRKALLYSHEQHVFDRTIGPGRMKAWIMCPEIECRE